MVITSIGAKKVQIRRPFIDLSVCLILDYTNTTVMGFEKGKDATMYDIQWDTNTGGILLSDNREWGVRSEIRPVFLRN